MALIYFCRLRYTIAMALIVASSFPLSLSFISLVLGQNVFPLHLGGAVTLSIVFYFIARSDLKREKLPPGTTWIEYMEFKKAKRAKRT
jgi:hypothetical protein